MRCPVCDVTLSISSRDGVEIDFCPQCRGVWLDRGELDKIIERAATAGRSNDRYDDRDRRPDDRYQGRYDDRDRRHDDRYDRDRRYDDRDRGYDKRRKRRSFLEEMFDFD